GDLVGAGGGLRRGQHGDAGRAQHLAGDADLGAGQRRQPGGVAERDLLGVRVDEQEDQVGAAHRGGELVFGRAGGLPHGAALDGGDGGRLVAAVAVAEVGEGGGHRVEHREHLEGEEEDGAGDEVLGRDVPPGEVEVADDGGGAEQHAQPDPGPGGDQRRRGVEQDRGGDGQHRDPAHHEGGGDGAAGPRSPAGLRG